MRFAITLCLLLLSSTTLADVIYMDHQPASVVAAKLNQVNRKKIRFADPAAGKKIVSGRFLTDHPEGFVHALERIYPDIQVTETKDGWIVATRKKPHG